MLAKVPPPVIVLAFANDAGNYLPRLAEEARRTEEHLRTAQDRGLCRVVAIEQATVEKILDVFENADYRDHIAVFHFAGHADHYRLLLEDAQGNRLPADAGGLAGFFGQQHGLKLVFLNGCATEPQAEEFMANGVPVVIATSTAIDDGVAATFAARFYYAVANGATLKTAFDEATQEQTIPAGRTARHLYAPEFRQTSVQPDRWPWVWKVRAGSESALHWNLPEAAENPLSGLPDPDLPPDPPASPYPPALNWYTPQYAALFFGRGRDIRSLYERMHPYRDGNGQGQDSGSDPGPASAPVVLYYGQSGTGKSSVLTAGLKPRLDKKAIAHYIRRQRDQGLLGGMAAALGIPPSEEKLAHAWWAREQEAGQPIHILLDQVDEVFTLPRAEGLDELDRLLCALQSLQAPGSEKPRGKLLLSFRKERLAEIERLCQGKAIAFDKVYLQPLDVRGVCEVVLGPTRGHLEDVYHLAVEDGLEIRIANELTNDRESPVATILHILLNRMWEAAIGRDPQHPRFDADLLAQNQISLADFLVEQMGKVQDAVPEAVESGFLLDVLHFHTTALGTARQHSKDELRREYPHRGDLDTVVREAKQNYLLAEPGGDSAEGDAAEGSRLAHDTLAPYVHAEYARSERRGQRARRILETHWQNEGGEIAADAVLNEGDLKQVEAGAGAMRTPTSPETQLIQRSQADRIHRRRVRRTQWTAGTLGACALLLLGVLAWRYAQDAQASSFERQRADSLRLAGLAEGKLAEDPQVSLRLALAALPAGGGQPLVPQAGQVLRESLLAARERAAVPQTATRSEQYAENGRYLAAGGDSLAIYDLQAPLLGHPDFSLAAGIQGVAWSGDGKLAAWDAQRLYLLVEDPVHERWVSALTYRPRLTPRMIAPRGDTIGAVAWRPDGKELAIVTTSAVYIWDLGAGMLEKSPGLLVTPDAAATGQPGAKWSGDGKELAAWNASLLLWDRNRPLASAELLPVTSYISVAEWTDDGRFVYGANGDSELSVWEGAQKDVRTIPLGTEGTAATVDHGRILTGTARGQEQILLWNENKGGVALYPLSGDPPTALHPLNDQVRGVVIAPDGTSLLAYGEQWLERLAYADRPPRPISAGELQLGTAQITNVWWPESGTLLVRTLDGVLRGYTLDASDQLAQRYVLAGLPGDGEELAVVRPLGEERLLTASYCEDCESPGSVRIWQAGDRQLADEDGVPPADADLCSQIQRGLPLPTGVRDLRTVLWRDGDTLLIADAYGAALRWELGKGAPDVLPSLPDGESANVVFIADGSALLRYVDSSGGTLWRHQPGAWTPLAVPVPAQRVLADVVAAIGLATGMAASSSDGHTVWIEPARGRAQLLSDGDGLLAAAVQLDAGQIVLGYKSGRVQLWDTARGREVASQPPIGQSAVASLSVGNGNKSVLAKYSAPGAFRLFDANLQEVPEPWPTVGALLGDEVQLAPDAVRAASVADGILRILVEGSPAPAWVSSGVAETLKWYFVKAEWSRDGSLLLTQQSNQAMMPHRPEVAVWQWNKALQTLELLLVYGAESAAWRPDNAYLLGVGSDTLLNGQLHLVPVWPDPAPLIDRLRREADAVQPGCPLTRSISPQQMQGYLMEAKPQP